MFSTLLPTSKNMYLQTKDVLQSAKVKFQRFFSKKFEQQNRLNKKTRTSHDLNVYLLYQ